MTNAFLRTCQPRHDAPSHVEFHKKNSRTMRNKVAVSGRTKMQLKNKHLDARKETEKKKKGRNYARATQRLRNHGEDMVGMG